MLTELGVRGGPSLSLSLAHAETILVIDGLCFDVGLTLLGPGCLGLAYGRFLGLFSCARDVGLLFGFVCFPGLWGFCLVVLLVVPVCGCWVLFFWFDWLFVLVIPVCG